MPNNRQEDKTNRTLRMTRTVLPIRFGFIRLTLLLLPLLFMPLLLLVLVFVSPPLLLTELPLLGSIIVPFMGVEGTAIDEVIGERLYGERKSHVSFYGE